MIQEVITYIILAVAVAVSVYRTIKILKGNPPDCGCGKGKNCVKNKVTN